MTDRERLLELLTRLAYERRRVLLSSGRESDFYIDTKQASLTACLLYTSPSPRDSA